MAEWKTVRLGTIASTNQDTYSPKENWQFINYLDTGNITMNRIDEVQHINTSMDKLPSRAKRKVKSNSIIYSTVRPNQLHYGIIKEQPENFLVSTGFTVIDVNMEKAVPDYIYYVLTQKEITEHLQAIAEQSVSAYPSLKPSDIENLEVLLPDIDTQKATVAILGVIDEKIKQNTEINNNLEQQAQAIYNNMVTYSVDDTLPTEWYKGTVEDIIEIHDSKRIPLSGQARQKMEKKTYPYYGAASLMDYVDDYIFEGKYLLLGEDGTVVDAAGFPILQYVWGKFWVNNHAHILTGKHGFTVESLMLLFRSTPVKSIVTGAVQPKISQANLKSIPVVIPSEAVLSELNNAIEPLFSRIRVNIEENKSLAALRDALLPKLMSGEIDVSDITF